MQTSNGIRSRQNATVPRLAITVVLLVAILGLFFVSKSFASAGSYTIPSTIASDCSVDVTSSLLSWFAAVPDNAVLSFANNGCYRVEGTLQLTNRAGLDFEGNGSIFKSLNAPSDQRALWRFYSSSGLKIRNMTVQGSYATPGIFSSGLQHAHGFDIRGSNVDIGNVVIRNVPGDGVYFGIGSDNQTQSSGSFHDSTVNGTSRNGVSVTAGHDIAVSNVTTSLVGYDVFDVEPNTGYPTQNWGAARTSFTGNHIGSYSLVAFSVVPNAPVGDLTFSNNTFTGQGIKIATGTQTYRPANVTIQSNTSDTAQAPAAMNLNQIDGLIVTGNTVPMTGGTMASVTSSCTVQVSGNSYPGGNAEVSTATYSCPTPTTSPSPSASSTPTASSSPIASPSPTASSSPIPSPSPTVSSIPTEAPSPTVTLTAPLNGSRISGALVKIAAVGSAGVIKIQIYIDGVLRASSNASSISLSWNVKKVVVGAHTISARVYDASNQVGSASITVFK